MRCRSFSSVAVAAFALFLAAPSSAAAYPGYGFEMDRYFCYGNYGRYEGCSWFNMSARHTWGFVSNKHEDSYNHEFPSHNVEPSVCAYIHKWGGEYVNTPRWFGGCAFNQGRYCWSGTYPDTCTDQDGWWAYPEIHSWTDNHHTHDQRGHALALARPVLWERLG